MRCFRSGSYAFPSWKERGVSGCEKLAELPETGRLGSERTGFYASVDLLPVCFILVSRDKGEAAAVFELLYDMMPMGPEDYEPMMNLLVWREDDVWITCIFPRRELRPSCYYAEGDANILISPATVEMAGLFVVPLEKDFKKVTFGRPRKGLGRGKYYGG